MKQYNDKTIERGVAIYLAFMVMTILLAISLGLNVILIGQTKAIKGMGDSVIAFYAADSGIEKILYEAKICYQDPCSPPPSCKMGCFGLVEDYELSGNLGNANYVVNHEYCPDFNGDGTVDMLFDQPIFLLSFGANFGDPNYNEKCDFDGNGIVDIFDLGTFSDKLGNSCAGFSYFKSSGEFQNTKRAIELAR